MDRPLWQRRDAARCDEEPRSEEGRLGHRDRAWLEGHGAAASQERDAVRLHEPDLDRVTGEKQPAAPEALGAVGLAAREIGPIFPLWCSVASSLPAASANT